jgi:crotonobetainyl-CoA:carnitine CoA-transferase CaiB-like acyl-CoA transferase
MAIADKVSGLHAVYAVLAALLHRERTDEGQMVEVPMFESFTHFLLQEHLYGRTFLPPNDLAGYPRQVDPDRQPMRTLDGYISIAPYTDDRWVRFFEVTGDASFLIDNGLTNARSRHCGLTLMQRRMAEIVAERNTDHWLQMAAEHDIPATRVRDLNDVLEDPHLRMVGFFRERIHPTEGHYIEMRAPVRFSVQEETLPRPAPLLGEHSAEILSELGFESPE